MLKRKLPGGMAAATSTQAEPTAGCMMSNDQTYERTSHQNTDAAQPLAEKIFTGDRNKRAAIGHITTDSAQVQAPSAHDNNHQRRVVPEVPTDLSAIVIAQSQQTQSTMNRVAPIGSPASEFMMASPKRCASDTADMTCDLLAIPRDRWNKRRSLSAIVIAVLAIQTKAATVRRNVVLRDEHAECVCTVWGNHTNVINEQAIGRPITLQRICLTEYEGKVQIAMPKDSSVSIGNTPATAPIMLWMQQAGSNMHTVQQVPFCQKLTRY